MTLFSELISSPLVCLGMYSSVVDFIHHGVMTKKANPFTNIMSAARFNLFLRSKIF